MGAAARGHVEIAEFKGAGRPDPASEGCDRGQGVGINNRQIPCEQVNETRGGVNAARIGLTGLLHIRAEYRGPQALTYVFKPLTTSLLIALAIYLLQEKMIFLSGMPGRQLTASIPSRGS